MRHVWIDFENGGLNPKQIPELFPHLRTAFFNTYNHTNDTPRFRVIISFDEAISSDDFKVAYNNLIVKIEDAGYGIGKTKGGLQSGLDVSKKSPTSLFYLPCQAKDEFQSFFHGYNETETARSGDVDWEYGGSVSKRQSRTDCPTRKRSRCNCRCRSYAGLASAAFVRLPAASTGGTFGRPSPER